MNPRTWLLPLLGVAFGLLGGVLLSQSLFEQRMERMLDEKLAELMAHQRLLAARQVVAAPSPVGGDSREELRQIREQLAALAARQAVAGPGARPVESEERPEKPPPSPPTPAQEEASRRAQEVLDTALARGRWTEEDDFRFQRWIAQAAPERMQELSSSLSMAINSGRLRPIFTGGGSP